MATQSQSPLVTVIVPCYNQGRWLGECLSSIKVSTYKNLEIILVDDGSTDVFTKSLLDSFHEDGVRLIRQSNQGLCAVRNNAVAISHGEFILSVDSDDVLAPDFIAHAVDCLRKRPDVAMVGSDYVYLDDETKALSSPVHGLRHSGRVTSKIMSCNIITSNYVYRRSLFDAVGGFSIDLTRLAIEDVDFTMRAFKKGFGVYVLPEVGLQYRQHGMSMNNNQNKRRRAKLVVFRHHLDWFLFHPLHALAFLMWNKFGWLLAGKSFTIREE